MKLTILHPGDPNRARIVNSETGEVLESVVSYSLQAPHRQPETLTVTVRLPLGASNVSHRFGDTMTIPSQQK